MIHTGLSTDMQWLTALLYTIGRENIPKGAAFSKEKSED